MPRDDVARVRDIVEACDWTVKATAKLGLESFSQSDLMIRAVRHDFAVIGQAPKGVSRKMRVASPWIPWWEMAGMRDIMQRQYFGLDADIVWRAAKRACRAFLCSSAKS